ncbi:mRNA-degrading endonuclease toxin of MazEF toxin-antitoxin module [Bacillus sp. RC242]|uniref:type II toxin-antitoxin system PemK/MazF family toxin n=1 Tax=Bacillus sp. RC242 TaxID=3156286 RepID=UPI003834255D
MKLGDIYLLEIQGELTNNKLVPCLILSKIQNNTTLVVRINTKIPDQSKLQNIVTIEPTIPVFPHPPYIDFQNTMSVHISRLKTKISKLDQDLVELVIKEVTNADGSVDTIYTASMTVTGR